jgi:DNA-binding MarR family transcriptional regulator
LPASIYFASATTPTSTHTATDTAARLRHATARLWRRLRDSTPSTGLTQTEASVLFSVARGGPVRMSELARTEDLNPTMLSRVVGGLADRGLLERLPDPADRRAVIVAATEKAARLREDVLQARTDALAAHLDRLGAEERRALDEALPVLERLIEDMQRERA